MDYIGSKEKLNSWIFNKLELFIPRSEWKKKTFLDGCAGSGSTSKYAMKQGFTVISNDLMKFSSILLSGYSGISEKDNLVIEAHISAINMIGRKKGFFYKHYSEDAGRLYFSNENAQLIDAAQRYIFRIKQIHIRNHLLYISLEAMSRILNTTGVQAAHLKKLKPRAKEEFRLRREPFFYYQNSYHYNEDIYTLLKNRSVNEDILYIDPPYNERQYGPNYHLYETFVRNDNPEIRGKTGLRKWEKESKSNFCNKEKCIDFLDKIILYTDARLILISYSSDGLLTSQDIANLIISRSNSEPTLFYKLQKRYKADSKRENNEKLLTEYLFIFKNTPTNPIF